MFSLRDPQMIVVGLKVPRGAARQSMNSALCRREAQSMHTVESPRAAVWNESLMSLTCSYRPKLFCNRPGLLRLHVASVQRCLPFYEQDVALRLRDRIVSNAFWD